MKHYIETRQCDDGFTYEVWDRPGIHGFPMYYPAAVNTKGLQSLAGGQTFPTPNDVHKAMNLPRPS